MTLATVYNQQETAQKKNIEDKIKINTCNHPTPKVHIYLQKQLKIDENIKINPCNHPTPKVHIYLQKHFKVDDKNKIKPCNHPTPKVQIYLQKHRIGSVSYRIGIGSETR